MMDNGLLNELDEITKDNIARVLWNMEFDPDKIPKNVLECLSSDKNSPQNVCRKNEVSSSQGNI